LRALVAERFAACAHVFASAGLRQLAGGRPSAGGEERGVDPETVWLTSQRYRRRLERALYEHLDRGRRLLDAQHDNDRGAGVSPPPEAVRVDVRLLTEEVIKRNWYRRVGRKPSGFCWKATTSSRAGKNVVRGRTG